MAGIGFVFRKLNPHQSFGGMLRVYGAAGIISSGPWLLSILGIIVIGVVAADAIADPNEVVQFQVSVTYLFALSLVATGLLQLLFTRFVADRIFEKKEEVIGANLVGVVTVTTLVSGVVGFLIVAWFFRGLSIAYRGLMLSGFVVMCDIWMVVVLLTGLKAYRTVLAVFVVGWGSTIGLAVAFKAAGLEGLLAGFVAGHLILFFLLFGILIRTYPSPCVVAFDFLNRAQIRPNLAIIGFFYNLAIWTDKFLFWSNPSTSHPVIGPLRASLFYDVPIYLAYLTIVPGMAVFLVRMETDFSLLYDSFYDQVRQGATLESIERTRDNMIQTVRQGLYEIFKVQGLTLLIVFLSGPLLLELLGISPLYLNLFYVDATAVGAQVLLLAVLNVLFYLDQRKTALRLCLIFAIMNTVFTLITQHLGPLFYGYGFATAVVLTTLLGMWSLSKILDGLVSETFMLQSVET